MPDLTTSEKIAYIQTDMVSVTMKGALSHPGFAGIDFSKKESQIDISCEDSFQVDLAVDKDLISLLDLGQSCRQVYRMCPIFFEQQRYELVIEPQAGHKVEFWHENYNIRKNITPVGRNEEILSGIINFGNEIGMSDLIIILDGKKYMKISVEVFPSKISYKEDYKAIVSDITTEVYNLVFDFLKKTYSTFDISSKKQASLAEFFAIIRKIYDKFIVAADMVIAKPHHVLTKEYEVLPSYKAKRTDNRSLRWLEKHPDKIKRINNRLMAEEVLAVKKYVTYDTKENRLTKFMLQNTASRLELLKKQYSKLDRNMDQDVLDKIDQMISGINRRCNTGFMREVSAMPVKTGMSLVFGMAPGYRELFRCYLLLQHGLSVTGSVFNVSVKDLAVLYEYWCFIKLNSLMRQKYKLISQDIIKVSGNGLFVSLIKGQKSQVQYENPANGEIITLSYNLPESKGVTVSQKPDNVLSLQKHGSDVDYEYVFDAKYKINPALPDSPYKRSYGTPGPQETDINTMHRYRDAIVSDKTNGDLYERKMFGAYVLFPYGNEEEYKNHTFYKSIDKVNIGGLPFLPSATTLVTKMLDELITDSPDSAFERTTLPVGIEKRLAKIDWDRRDTLIGTFENITQYDYCKLKRVYYLPVSAIEEKDLPIHYLALFQTDNISDQPAGIYYFGEVIRTSVITKGNIPILDSDDKDRNDMYYQLVVRGWNVLKDPILAEQASFTYNLTNKFLLDTAECIPELLLRSEAEYRFYMELKRRMKGKLSDKKDDMKGFELNEFRVEFNGTQINVFKGIESVGRAEVEMFLKHPNVMLRQIQEYIDGMNRENE